MRTRWCLLAVGLLVLNGVAAPVRAEPLPPWKAGAAKVVITPTEPVWMAGYAGRNGPSQGKLVDLYARALVLRGSSDEPLVLVTLDLIEIPAAFRDQILDMAQRRHGLKPEQLLLNVSHTHGGPMLSAQNVADWGIDAHWGGAAEKYVRDVVGKIDVAIGEALAGQMNANVRYAHARCGFAMNRRQQTLDGFRLGLNPDGPVDHDVPVLAVRSADDKLIALVFGYACHNTALGPVREINGDYAGFAQRRLESEHPEAVALFLAGCGGDQDPAPRRHVQDAEQHGLALASAVEAGLAAPSLPLDSRLSVSLETCPLPFAPLPPRNELEARAASPNGFVSRHARRILDQWPNPGDHPRDYPLTVQVIQLGGKLTIVALGGEPVVDYSLSLRKQLGGDQQPVWIAGYSNLVSAYVPNRRVLKEGGYEGTEAVIYQSLPGPFVPEIEERITESVVRQVQRLRSNEKAIAAP